MTEQKYTSGWVEQFLTEGDELGSGGTVTGGHVGVRLVGGVELTDWPEQIARLGRELYERFSGRAFPDGIDQPRVLVTGDPINGFQFFGPTPLADPDGYREARVRRLSDNEEETWLPPLLPLAELLPIDDDDVPPAVQETPVERARRAVHAHLRLRHPAAAVSREEVEERLADLIADLLHLADHEDLDPDGVVDHGIRSYHGDRGAQG